MKMRIENRPALEAYIGESGDICLRQENPEIGDAIIWISPGDVEQVIDWLQTLLKERNSSRNEQFEHHDKEHE